MESPVERERTLILRVGISNRGFTLFELVVVLFIVSLISLVVFPKLQGFLAPDLPGTARHLIATIQRLRDEAEATKQIRRLNYDLNTGEYWAGLESETSSPAGGTGG